MSITATVQDDNIKLPSGLHLPNGTSVRVFPIQVKKGPIREDDPIYRMHEFAEPCGPMTDREMDALIYGV